jgi:NAD(P)H dehydrogenase (quinone)
MTNHLIIYAHPSQRSFSNLLTQRLANLSIKKGWGVEVRDLYAIGFNPVLSPNDLEKLKKGNTPEDIAIEQKFLANADVVTLVFPLWWASYPAIIKGYIDRVLSFGFAYKVGENGIEGLLKGKKVVLFTSMGNSLEQYEEKNLFGAFKQTLGHEVFDFCGMEIIHHEFFPQIPDASDEIKNEYAERALKVFELI